MHSRVCEINKCQMIATQRPGAPDLPQHKADDPVTFQQLLQH